MLKQSIILVSGHVCSGKTSLLLSLKNFLGDNIQHVNIANHNSENNSYQKFELEYIEKRFLRIIEEAYKGIFNNKIPFIEVVGDEVWFKNLHKALNQSHIPLISVQLKRASLKMAKECLEERVSSDCPFFNDQIKRAELKDLIKTYQSVNNPEIKQFYTSKKSLNGADSYILNKIIRR